MNCTCQKSQEPRKVFPAVCLKEDLDEIMLITEKIHCATQAAMPSSIPEGIPEREARIFVMASLDALGSYRWLQNRWWAMARERYNLPRDQEIHIDFTTGSFYVME